MYTLMAYGRMNWKNEVQMYRCHNEEIEFVKDSFVEYDPAKTWSQLEYLQNWNKTNWTDETAELLQPYLDFATSDG